MTLICVVQHFWSVVLFWGCQTGPEKKKKLTVLLLLFLFLFRLWVFLYFIFIFISSSYTRFAQKFPENQKIKKFWPYDVTPHLAWTIVMRGHNVFVWQLKGETFHKIIR